MAATGALRLFAPELQSLSLERLLESAPGGSLDTLLAGVERQSGPVVLKGPIAVAL